ncbi:hypothetical protein RFN58_25460 [Streptomyces iakyrus]|uniref:hypothetical protein n=1 Tax=Streptomyces iakyrus TaxID=68219 RepID=UPI0012FF0B97|nr:hypothetical protein [Streptomyces iakyrus]
MSAQLRLHKAHDRISRRFAGNSDATWRAHRIRRSGRKVFLVALLSVVVAWSTACEPNDSQKSQGQQEASRHLTMAEREVLVQAEKILTRDCMKRQGFSFWVTPELPEPLERRFPYVIDDKQWAAANGYGRGIRERREASARNDPNRRYFDRLSADRKAAAITALNGPTPEGLEADVPGMGRIRHSDKGCVSHAQRELYTDLPAWYRAKKVTEALDRTTTAAVVADPELRPVTRQWATCMHERGLPYDMPQKTREQFALRPEADEFATAQAEAECARSTGLAATLRELSRAHRQRMDSRHPTEVKNRALLEHKALSRARDIVRRG